MIIRIFWISCLFIYENQNNIKHLCDLLLALSLESVEEMKQAQGLSCFMILIIYPIFLSTSIVESLVYNVGDSENWNTGVNYLSWSQKYNFTVGDTLG